MQTHYLQEDNASVATGNWGSAISLVCFHIDGAIVYRLGHKVFILGSGVRFPVALPESRYYFR
jgi:hypothetical protein